MNRPGRWALSMLKATGFNIARSIDRALDIIDRDDDEAEASRSAYAQDLTEYIEGPTRRLPPRRKEPT